MPAQPALTDGGAERASHRILKRALIVLAVIWTLAVVRIVWSGGDSASTSHRVNSPVTVASEVTIPGAVVDKGSQTASPGPSASDLVAIATVRSFIPAWLTPGSPDQRQ